MNYHYFKALSGTKLLFRFLCCLHSCDKCVAWGTLWLHKRHRERLHTFLPRGLSRRKMYCLEITVVSYLDQFHNSHYLRLCTRLFWAELSWQKKQQYQSNRHWSQMFEGLSWTVFQVRMVTSRTNFWLLSIYCLLQFLTIACDSILHLWWQWSCCIDTVLGFERLVAVSRRSGPCSCYCYGWSLSPESFLCLLYSRGVVDPLRPGLWASVSMLCLCIYRFHLFSLIQSDFNVSNKEVYFFQH